MGTKIAALVGLLATLGCVSGSVDWYDAGVRLEGAVQLGTSPCDEFDYDGDGIIGMDDFGQFSIEVSAGARDPGELEDFRACYGTTL